MNRFKTGVLGLDDKIGGGFVEGSITLVAGKSGTGKTQFSSSFVYQGAKEGQVGLYITTEEKIEDIQNDIASMFEWDFNSYVEKGLIYFMTVKPLFPDKGEISTTLIRSYINSLSSRIEEAIRKTKSQRVVIDSISVWEMFISNGYMARVALFALLEKLKELKVTVAITGEVPETSEGLSGSGIVEYLVDGVIKLDFVPVSEEFKRTLTIRKMRRTNHSTLIHPFEVTSKGMKLIEF